MASVEQVTGLFQKLSTGSSAAERAPHASEVANMVKSQGASAIESAGIAAKLQEALNDTANPTAREGALEAFTALVKAVGPTAEPFVMGLLPAVLDRLSDKVAPVRTAAEAAVPAVIDTVNPYSVEDVLVHVFDGMAQAKGWQTKVGALNAMKTLAARAPRQIAKQLPHIVPQVTQCFADAKVQVKEAAQSATMDCFKVNGNRDIEVFIPHLVNCIANPGLTTDTIHKLAATTFVQQVEAPPLAIIVPLLVRGLRERTTAIKRKSCVIIDNMAKLVDNPADAAPFLPRLMPELEKVKEEVADPECRQVANRAYATLHRVGGAGKTTVAPKADPKIYVEGLKAELGSKLSGVEPKIVEYIGSRLAHTVEHRHFEGQDFVDAALPFLPNLKEDEVKPALQKMAQKAWDEAEKAAIAAQEDEEEGVEDLCNCEFSLAYGAKILLNNTRLRLKRGMRYGLCGPNGSGKSTLMRAIVNGQVEGFPPRDQLKTVYVEHDIDHEAAELWPVDFIYTDPTFEGMPKEEIEGGLRDVGFNDELLRKGVAALSGGWKMKLALARAMLQKADILLLDEPTNHLDVHNVAWVKNYLVSLKNVTSIVVSHDSGFLDYICTHIIHYENRKLRIYRGNLTEFVRQKPEARSYYELSASAVSFKFPEPGYLEGVKTKDKAILKMQKVGFTYPGAPKPTLSDVSIYITLSSRVAVLGANGAGKSTMIRMLTGELEPCEGTVWKHPNLRIAYVAQHAFHHIEQHLDISANQYIQWRYAIGEDREALGKVDRKITEEEAKKMAKAMTIDGQKRVVEKVLGRRKFKSTYEYEVRAAACN
ncbi:hypothetical protein DUNSADRAFT_12961 [Dunaliella salina]|uniref:Elongation factor 3 n=1 Tax=Dunaliella salina TaxID=3046 RepID=A0ABQ7GAJ3_DUNSA|nr:hypothetical protein DUNSADRAFT_12961 [Dunaliella salina]|eukprot:KAF5831548.1 hypothetical protein DUNSADRAFT_12961 [Dunaliella salina]